MLEVFCNQTVHELRPGDALVLFNYSGTLTDLMSLSAPTIVVSDGWLTYDAFVAEFVGAADWVARCQDGRF